MAETDMEHVRVRYKGASVLDVRNPHRDSFTEGVKAGDIIEVPAQEVAAWGDSPPSDWEVVKADTPTVKKVAAVAAEGTPKEDK